MGRVWSQTCPDLTETNPKSEGEEALKQFVKVSPLGHSARPRRAKGGLGAGGKQKRCLLKVHYFLS